MSRTSETGPYPHQIAGRSAVLALLAVFVVILAAATATYAYQQTRLDLQQRQAAIAVTGGDPDRGARSMERYGCGGCHTITGIPAATGLVGPDLSDLGRHVYVAGVTTNTPDHLVAFIVDPQSIDPKSAMPLTGISAQQARDVAAYLYAIRR
jgi:cytochrome c